jgi:hypothetical protein
VFIELGTHFGESYFAFCQAIEATGTKCKAYAVDTWQGDIHTGAYGNEVFNEVDSYNRCRYSEFSQLMRMRFDDAIESFEPESIDLLHIDGTHTYEAVRHDFDSWWSRIKPGGIVLLHDTFERDAGFGVWKLLEELSQTFPTAEFRHSHGLGVVLKPGAVAGQGVIPLLFNKDKVELESLRRFYEVCADHLEHQFWLERQRHPGDWDVTTQLFWRGAGENFTEPASVRSTHTLTPDRSRVALPVPSMAAPAIELRLDLANCSAFFAMHAIYILDTKGEVLWQWLAMDGTDDLRRSGSNFVAAAGEESVLVMDAPLGASFVLPAPESIVQGLQSGGEVVVEMTGLSPTSFVSKLATAFEWRLTRQQAKSDEIQIALDHAQRLALGRQEELKQYDRALVEAQRLAAENSKGEQGRTTHRETGRGRKDVDGK